MARYSVEPKQENMSKKFCHSREIYSANMGKNYWIPLQKQD